MVILNKNKICIVSQLHAVNYIVAPLNDTCIKINQFVKHKVYIANDASFYLWLNII